MKPILVLAAIIGFNLISADAEARVRRCYWDSWGVRHCYWHRYPPRRYPPPYWGAEYRVVCAPEVAEGNVQATERVLNEVAARPEFANAKVYQARVDSLRNLDTPEKLDAYFAILEINPSDKNEILNFIGARETNTKYIEAAAKNLDLTVEQSTVLTGELQKALLGNLSN